MPKAALLGDIGTEHGVAISIIVTPVLLCY